MASLKATACWLVAISSAGSYGAEPPTPLSPTVGQFVIQSALGHVLIYRDACVLSIPAMTRRFDEAAAVFRRCFAEAVAPLVAKYGTRAQFTLPAPQTWIENLDREESAMRTRLAEVDADSCERFLSNLRQLDIGALQAQLESSLDQITQVPLEQLKDD